MTAIVAQRWSWIDDGRVMIESTALACVVVAFANCLMGLRHMAAADRLEQKFLHLRRMLIGQAILLAGYVVTAFLWLRSEQMTSLRLRALEASTSPFQSDLVRALGGAVMLSAGLAAMVGILILPCLHVARAMHGFVLESTQRRIAEEQVAALGGGRKL